MFLFRPSWSAAWQPCRDLWRGRRWPDDQQRARQGCGLPCDQRHVASHEPALTPVQVVSPLAARPYDLRHAAVPLWLNAGVPAPGMAESAGHSVQVLLRVYAKCQIGGVGIPHISHGQRLAAALMASSCMYFEQASAAASRLIWCSGWWQVLGSNQRRLSRRFYSYPPPAT